MQIFSQPNTPHRQLIKCFITQFLNQNYLQSPQIPISSSFDNIMKPIEERLKHFRQENRREKVEEDRKRIRESLMSEIDVKDMIQVFNLTDCPQLASNPIKAILKNRYAVLVNPCQLDESSEQLVWKIPLKLYYSFWKYVGMVWEDLDEESVNLIKNIAMDFIDNFKAQFLHEFPKLENKLLIIFASISSELNQPQKENLLQWLYGIEALDIMQTLIDWASPPSRLTYKNLYMAIQTGLFSQNEKYQESAARVMVRILKYNSNSQGYDFEMKQPKVVKQLNNALRSSVILQSQWLWLALYYVLRSDDQILLKYSADVIISCTIMMNRITPVIVFGALQLLQLMSDFKHSLIWELLMGPNLMPTWLLNADKHKFYDKSDVSFKRSYYSTLRNLVIAANETQLQLMCSRYINGNNGVPQRLFRSISEQEKDDQSRLYGLQSLSRMLFGDDGVTKWQESLEEKLQKSQISKKIKLIIQKASGIQLRLSEQIENKLSQLRRKRLEKAITEIEKTKLANKASKIRISQYQRSQIQQKWKNESKQVKNEWIEMIQEEKKKKIKEQQKKKAEMQIVIEIEEKKEVRKSAEIKKEQKESMKRQPSIDQITHHKTQKQQPNVKPRNRKEKKPKEKKLKVEGMKIRQE